MPALHRRPNAEVHSDLARKTPHRSGATQVRGFWISKKPTLPEPAGLGQCAYSSKRPPALSWERTCTPNPG